MDINEIAEILTAEIPKENIYVNEPMKKHTTFKIGGNADIFIKGKTISNIEFVLKVANEHKLPLTIMGNGSNVLVKDNGIKGLVLKICIDKYEIIKEDDFAFVKVEAGMLNAKLAQILLKEGVAGFEFASGIPGTIGGAIRMNAGAYGSEIKDIIEETTYIDLNDDKIKTMQKNEQDFSYRHSIFETKKAIILSAKFKFKYGNKEEIKEKMEENLSSRRTKQPIEWPSAGSTFKRGEDFITAKLIDDCGLKGTKVGDAQVSEKHAGFVVNLGNATANDVIKLIKIVQEKVLEKTGKKIKLEIEIIGD